MASSAPSGSTIGGTETARRIASARAASVSSSGISGSSTANSSPP